MANGGFVNGAMKAVTSAEVVVTSGDPWYQVTLGSTRSYCLGLDDSDSDTLKINTNNSASVDPSSGTNLWTMTSGGINQKPLQPCFFGIKGSATTNATGDGTVVTLVCSEIFDQGSNYDGTTFTAPVTGKYLFNACAFLQAIGAQTGASMRINTTGRASLIGNLTAASKDAANGLTINGSIIVDMTAGDTCISTILASGSTKTVTLFGGGGTVPGTWFSGYLL